MKIYEFSQDAENYYLIIEYCEGGELLKKITKLNVFSEKIVAKIMWQILSAVNYCHSRNIVHR